MTRTFALVLVSFISACAGTPPVDDRPAPLSGPQGHADPPRPSERIEESLRALDAELGRMERDFKQTPADPHDTEWVKKKLATMAGRLDALQSWYNRGLQSGWNTGEIEFANRIQQDRFERIQAENVHDIKGLLEIHGWFAISKFGAEADGHAMRVMGSARDRALQRTILSRLDELVNQGETSPKNFAYLHDRVATHAKRPQRYGTQGRCMGPKWEPFELDDPDRVDELRKSVGLPPLDEYAGKFVDLCR